MGIGNNNAKAFIGTYSIQNTKFYVIDIVNLLNKTEIINEVLKLQNSDFDKSMTSHNNHLLWHDVYKKESDNYKLYIKIQILNSNTLIISFKGDESL